MEKLTSWPFSSRVSGSAFISQYRLSSSFAATLADPLVAASPFGDASFFSAAEDGFACALPTVLPFFYNAPVSVHDFISSHPFLTWDLLLRLRQS